MLFQRYSDNPILAANPQNQWENYAVYNGTIIKKDNKFHLFYRAMGSEVEIDKKKLRLSVVGKAESRDGYKFTDRKIFLSPDHEWERYGCEDPRVTKLNDWYFIFYTALSDYPPSSSGIRVGVSLTKDLNKIEQKHLVTPFNAKAMTIFPEKINDLYTVILTVNTDNPPTFIAYAQFAKLETLWNMNFWNNWYRDIYFHFVQNKFERSLFNN